MPVLEPGPVERGFLVDRAGAVADAMSATLSVQRNSGLSLVLEPRAVERALLVVVWGRDGPCVEIR